MTDNGRTTPQAVEAAWAEIEPLMREAIGRDFDRWLEELQALCRIPSFSTSVAGLRDCAAALRAMLEPLGFAVEIDDLDGPDGPPIVVARRGANPDWPTLLIYGHFDVQPVDPVAAWTHPPFEPTVDGNLLYGRGTADDKGQFFSHLKALEALDRMGRPPAANLVLVLDSQEEVGSPQLERYVLANRAKLGADCVFYADGEAFPGNRVMVQHGNRGDCFLTLTLRSATRDAHSGTYGGVIPNAANQLVRFLASLVDDDGTVLIPGFYDNVRGPTDADRAVMARLPYDREEHLATFGLAREFGPAHLGHWEKIMFRPTLNVAGLSGGFQGAGTKTVIPSEASAKIDMRLVKDQTPDEIVEKVAAFAAARGLPHLEIERGMQYRPARTDPSHPFCALARAALARGFGQEPVVTPVIGGSNPNHIWMERLGLPMAEVSYGQHDCRMHAPDEHFRLDHFRAGILTSALVMTGFGRAGDVVRRRGEARA